MRRTFPHTPFGGAHRAAFNNHRRHRAPSGGGTVAFGAHIYLGTACRFNLLPGCCCAMRSVGDVQGWQNIWQTAWQQWKMGIGHRVNLAPASAWDEKRAKKPSSRVQPTAFLIKEKCSGRESEFCAINKDVYSWNAINKCAVLRSVGSAVCIWLPACSEFSLTRFFADRASFCGQFGVWNFIRGGFKGPLAFSEAAAIFN